MNEKQFDKFYWPPLKRVIDALVNEGILVTLFAEGAFNTRLERVNEFPKGAVQWMFDRTDMAAAKKILGDKVLYLRQRAQLAPRGRHTAGSEGACRKLIETWCADENWRGVVNEKVMR